MSAGGEFGFEINRECDALEVASTAKNLLTLIEPGFLESVRREVRVIVSSILSAVNNWTLDQ